MCVPVFDEKASVWFVGGRGDQSNRDSDLGGCTMDWWEAECPNKTQAEYDAAYKKIVNSTGGPIVALLNVPYTGDDEDTIYSAGAFEDVEAGMVAYVIENGTPDTNVATGRYEITAVTDDEITLDGINGADCDVDINIGGAFTDLDEAVDETSAIFHSVTIYTNLNVTLGSSVTITTGGSQLKNTFKRIIGYNTIPGDMSRGGTYYESPLEILQNGSIDSSKCVALDGDGGVLNILEVSSAENLVFENLHLTNASGDAVEFASVCTNVVFRNCRLTDLVRVIITECDNLLFDSC